MTLNFARGLKFGGGSAIAFGIVTAINKYIQGEVVSAKLLLGWMGFAFVPFAIIGILTDKIGSDFGEQ
ncbi:MAG: hypothetical protein ACKOVA_10110 [Novosphingobium sp.]